MKIVQVTYTVKSDYSEQNQQNIGKVMDDLRKAGHPGIVYHTCMKADGKTFIHSAFFQTEADEKILFATESFQRFQQQLKASGPELPPVQELLSLVGSSYKIFRNEK
jgi:hypothetical protein